MTPSWIILLLKEAKGHKFTEITNEDGNKKMSQVKILGNKTMKLEHWNTGTKGAESQTFVWLGKTVINKDTSYLHHLSGISRRRRRKTFCKKKKKNTWLSK